MPGQLAERAAAAVRPQIVLIDGQRAQQRQRALGFLLPRRSECLKLLTHDDLRRFNDHDPPPARKMPRGAGAGTGTTSTPRDPLLSPPRSGACRTASKFTSADS